MCYCLSLIYVHAACCAVVSTVHASVAGVPQSFQTHDWFGEVRNCRLYCPCWTLSRRWFSRIFLLIFTIYFYRLWDCICYLRRCLTSEGIVLLGVHAVCVSVELLISRVVSVAKVMRCIQCSLVAIICCFVLRYC